MGTASKRGLHLGGVPLVCRNQCVHILATCPALEIRHELRECSLILSQRRALDTPRRRRAALLELGVRPRLAGNTAGSGRGPWYLARAKALSVGLSNAYFKSLGLPSLFEEC